MRTGWKERLLSAVATSALVLGLVPAGALADAGDLTFDKDVTTPSHALTVSGLEEGDSAKYYKIIEQDATTKAWKLTAAVDSNNDHMVDGTEETSFGHKDADDNDVNGLWIDELVISSYETDEEGKEVTSDTRKLTAAMVNAIAAAVTANKATETGTANAADGVVTVTDYTPGMYMFVAVPGPKNIDNIYKPVFVSADFYNNESTPEDGTHAIAIVEDATDYSDDAGVFKKSKISIDKKSGTDEDWQNDVAVGDIVDFTITVPIPTYTKNYVAPMFYVTDVLTEGLKLKADSINVKVMNGEDEVAVTKDEDYRVFVKDSTENNKYFNFKNTEAKDSTLDGFVVQFLNDDPTTENVAQDGFLYTVVGAPKAVITYKATVTETAKQHFAQQVNQMDNTARLTYSNNPNYQSENEDTNEPDDEEPTGELEDKTRHYTFDIDADVLGEDQLEYDDEGEPDYSHEEDEDRTSEIRKTWLEANGTVTQTETTTKVVKGGAYEDGKENSYSWLEGAEFSLTRKKKHVATSAGEGSMVNLEDGDYTEVKFDSTSHIRVTEGGSNPVSDGKGYIAMKGLDAGVYILKEISAPLGYAFNPNVQYQITITPTYVLEAADATDGTKPQNGTGGGDDLILESYKVEIETQTLDDDLNIVGTETVNTISIYNIAKDEEGNPESILDADGEQDPEVTINKTVTTFGNNTTALVVNKKLGILPATGGSGIFFYLFVGGAVAAVALVLIKKVKQAGAAAA